MQVYKVILSAATVMVPMQSQADVHNHFSRALAALPAEIFQSREAAAFVNLHAHSIVFGTTDFTAAQAQRAVVALDTSPLQAMGTAESKTFEAKAGFASSEVDFLAVYGERPEQAVLWGGAQDFPKNLEQKLPDLGFSTLSNNQDLFANGELGAFNPAGMDATSPWMGPMGAASIVKIAPTIVYQASSEAALTRATAQPAAFDTAEGQAFTALQPAGDTYLMQSFIFSADFGRAVGEGISGASPVYQAGLLADLQSPQGPVTLLALSYESCAEAEDALQTPWPQNVSGVQGVTAEIEARCLALWRAPGGENAEVNTSFLQAWEAMQMRAFAPVALPQE